MDGPSSAPSYFNALPPSVQHAMMIAAGYVPSSSSPNPSAPMMASTAAPAAAGPAPAPSTAFVLPPPPPLTLTLPSSSSALPSPSPSLLITPPPAAALALSSTGPPPHHVFQGTKPPGPVACAVCGATSTGGGCWRRGWALVAGGEANLCNKDGLKLRHGKLKPPTDGVYAAVAKWRTVQPPRRGRAAAAAAAAAAGPSSSGKGNEEDDYSADEHEDEAAAAAWTLMGMSAPGGSGV